MNEQSTTNRFEALSSRNRALVAIAVLLDGREAEIYLEDDGNQASGLSNAAQEISQLPPEIRMPLIGGFLRSALVELSSQRK